VGWPSGAEGDAILVSPTIASQRVGVAYRGAERAEQIDQANGRRYVLATVDVRLLAI